MVSTARLLGDPPTAPLPRRSPIVCRRSFEKCQLVNRQSCQASTNCDFRGGDHAVITGRAGSGSAFTYVTVRMFRQRGGSTLQSTANATERKAQKIPEPELLRPGDNSDNVSPAASRGSRSEPTRPDFRAIRLALARGRGLSSARPRSVGEGEGRSARRAQLCCLGDRSRTWMP